jgi:hypothetical protein
MAEYNNGTSLSSVLVGILGFIINFWVESLLYAVVLNIATSCLILGFGFPVAVLYFRKIVFGTQEIPCENVIFLFLKRKSGSLITKNSVQDSKHQGLMGLDSDGLRYLACESNDVIKQNVRFPVKDFRFIKRGLD